jgi:hypothetical protein
VLAQKQEYPVLAFPISVNRANSDSLFRRSRFDPLNELVQLVSVEHAWMSSSSLQLYDCACIAITCQRQKFSGGCCWLRWVASCACSGARGTWCLGLRKRFIIMREKSISTNTTFGPSTAGMKNFYLFFGPQIIKKLNQTYCFAPVHAVSWHLRWCFLLGMRQL